jgi:hypothetical protein
MTSPPGAGIRFGALMGGVAPLGWPGTGVAIAMVAKAAIAARLSILCLRRLKAAVIRLAPAALRHDRFDRPADRFDRLLCADQW